MKFNAHLVLELIVRFELLVPKSGLSSVLSASTGSSRSLNVDFFEPTIYLMRLACSWRWNFCEIR